MLKDSSSLKWHCRKSQHTSQEKKAPGHNCLSPTNQQNGVINLHSRIHLHPQNYFQSITESVMFKAPHKLNKPTCIWNTVVWSKWERCKGHNLILQNKMGKDNWLCPGSWRKQSIFRENRLWVLGILANQNRRIFLTFKVLNALIIIFQIRTKYSLVVMCHSPLGS